MIFKMDTDSVRAMSIQFRRTAEAMEASMASIKQSVTAAPWQSQAREEFIMHLEMMQRSTQESVRVLHLMARAAERKADQWEAIANVFNGPFYYLEGVWDQVKNFMGGLWSGIKNAITSIRLPSLPRFVFPAISGGAIIGGITTLILTWEFKPPSWWPFKKEKHVEQPHTIDEDNQEGNVPTTPAATDVVTEIQPVEPVGLSQNDPNWSGVIMNPKAGGTIGQYGCLLTSVTMIARMKGADVTPIDTNKYLQDHGGYTGKTVKGVYKEGNYMRFDKAAEFLSEQTGKEVTYKM
jgi:hypothetical protein